MAATADIGRLDLYTQTRFCKGFSPLGIPSTVQFTMRDDPHFILTQINQSEQNKDYYALASLGRALLHDLITTQNDLEWTRVSLQEGENWPLIENLEPAHQLEFELWLHGQYKPVPGIGKYFPPHYKQWLDERQTQSSSSLIRISRLVS